MTFKLLVNVFCKYFLDDLIELVFKSDILGCSSFAGQVFSEVDGSSGVNVQTEWTLDRLGLQSHTVHVLATALDQCYSALMAEKGGYISVGRLPTLLCYVYLYAIVIMVSHLTITSKE